MNTDQLKGNWKQMKGRLKERWGKLTNDDLTRIDGEREVLVGRMQERYGWAKDRAERELDAFLKSDTSATASGKSTAESSAIGTRKAKPRTKSRPRPGA